MAMWQRHRNFWNEFLWKPKKPHSLEALKYQYYALERNPMVTSSNRNLLVETFRSIAEILIWGDQNDSSVWDFFLEKNMQSYFYKTLSQRCGRYVVLQLLQTLSILFENIRNETSIYYLLSNNHINCIIVLKFDFSDEEVLAYYISFLKTLSFKLNKHTVHFFYNEHLRDIPLYTEAIKFFNHPESMVRIAVRTLTLNVYKVEDKNMLEFIRNKTAAPYFSNLVWFIGNHVIHLDECLSQQADHLNRSRLEDLVAEHLDHLYYINDILNLDVVSLNEVITEHLLDRLLIPLYVYSLFEMAMSARAEEGTPRVSSTVALFLLSQVFLILSHSTLMSQLAYLILTGDHSLNLPPVLFEDSKSPSPVANTHSHHRSSSRGSVRGFLPPEETLIASLTPPVIRGTHVPARPLAAQPQAVVQQQCEGGGGGGGGGGGDDNGASGGKEGSSTESQSHMDELGTIPEYDGFVLIESPNPPIVLCAKDEEDKAEDEMSACGSGGLEEKQQCVSVTPLHGVPVMSTVFTDSILSAIIPSPDDDSRCLFAISLLYAITQNKGINSRLLEAFSLKRLSMSQETSYYHSELVGRLFSVVEASAVGSVRLITLHMCTLLLTTLLDLSDPCLEDRHLKKLERAVEGSCMQLSTYYNKSMGSTDDTFLEMFEDKYARGKRFNIKVNFLLMDSTVLLPPTGTPLTGIDFTKRHPCGETERAQRAMCVFFAIRQLKQQITHEDETVLPLTPTTTSAVTGDVIDTANCDLVNCDVISGEKKVSRFMLVTDNEFMLVEPDKSRLGCGVVTFIAFLQDVEIATDPADNCALYIIAHHRTRSQVKRRPALSARFVFSDHIRSLATKQNLIRHKEMLRQNKMSLIAEMLGIPSSQPLSTPFHSPRPVILPHPYEQNDRNTPTSEPSSDQVTLSPPPPEPTRESPSSSSLHSPSITHTLASQTLKTNPDTDDPAGQSVDIELNRLTNNGERDTSDGSSDSHSPLPTVHYVPGEEHVSLEIPVSQVIVDSPVRLLPPLGASNVTAPHLEFDESVLATPVHDESASSKSLGQHEQNEEREEAEEEEGAGTKYVPATEKLTNNEALAEIEKTESLSDEAGGRTEPEQMMEAVQDKESEEEEETRCLGSPQRKPRGVREYQVAVAALLTRTRLANSECDNDLLVDPLGSGTTGNEQPSGSGDTCYEQPLIELLGNGPIDSVTQVNETRKLHATDAKIGALSKNIEDNVDQTTQMNSTDDICDPLRQHHNATV